MTNFVTHDMPNFSTDDMPNFATHDMPNLAIGDMIQTVSFRFIPYTMSFWKPFRNEVQTCSQC